MEDGLLQTLPIPHADGPVTYDEIRMTDGSSTLGGLVEDLSRGKKPPHRIRRSRKAHLDPDLSSESLIERPPGWRPLFGQTGPAQAHLASQHVGLGDLFLFFGWFAHVERASGRYRYAATGDDSHVLFGWLQVGEVIKAHPRPDQPTWAREHPHFWSDLGKQSTVYVSARPGEIAGRPSLGAGAFHRYRPELRLTWPGRSRSHWRLPSWFAPRGERPPLTYHRRPSRWGSDGAYCALQTVGRGQEFVLDTTHYPEAEQWATALIAGRASS